MTVDEALAVDRRDFRSLGDGREKALNVLAGEVERLRADLAAWDSRWERLKARLHVRADRTRYDGCHVETIPARKAEQEHMLALIAELEPWT